MMKLRFSPTSPYVRKVLVCAIERGLDGRIERLATDAWDPATDLPAVNPLGKVPALQTDDGEVLYDSPVICEYLDSLHDGERLVPPSGPRRWRALRRQALADGMMDAAILRRLETRRSPSQQSASWIARQRDAVQRGLDALEAEAREAGADGTVTVGDIAVGCVLGYLDFRYADENWRRDRPALKRWFADFSARESMRRTEHG